LPVFKKEWQKCFRITAAEGQYSELRSK